MTFIIAEIGSNFKSINNCIEAIGHAKSVGADAVKFQMATERELYGRDAGLGIDEHFVKPEWLPLLKEKAVACNIEFMCTAFSVQGYSQVNQYVDRHKIASCENLHPGILQTLSYMAKPVICSLGATTMEEARYISQKLAKVHVTFLYCLVDYPTQQTRLETLDVLKPRLGRDVGFSDHSTDFTTIPVVAALKYGADVIEKHFNPLNFHDTPDAPHSITRSQFQTMVQRIRDVEQFNYLRGQTDALLKHKRRIIAISDIEIGDPLTSKNIGVFRSLTVDEHGLSPILYDRLINNKTPSPHKFKVGDPIHF